MKVAIWLQGGIGGGNFSQGYPPLMHFLCGLGEKIDVTVYSILPPNDDFQEKKLKVISPGKTISNTKLRTALLMARFIRDHVRKKYDIVHAFWVYPAGTVALLLGSALQIPTIVTVQGGEAAAVPEIKYGNMLRPWLKKITLATCKRATVLNSISKFLLSQLALHGLKRTDGVVTPFGPDVNRFAFHPRSIGTPLRLMHVANLTEVKDQDTILRAVRILADQIELKLQIIGADYLNGFLQQRCRELGIESLVEFAGSVPQHALPAFYKDNHIMVHTSLHEGQSGVIMEAMASGVVVCATPVGIVFDLGEKFFKVVPFSDSAALANAVLELMADPAIYFRLQTSCLNYAQSHNAQWTQDQYYKIYEKLVAN